MRTYFVIVGRKSGEYYAYNCDVPVAGAPPLVRVGFDLIDACHFDSREEAQKSIDDEVYYYPNTNPNAFEIVEVNSSGRV